MRRLTYLIFPLIVFGFYAYNSGYLPSVFYGSGDSYEQSEIVRVIDGDTVEVNIPGKGNKDVRLIGIDTPESVRPGVSVECGAEAASAHMKEIAEGQTVTVETDPTQDSEDRYGRMLAYLILNNGETLQEEQLRAGYAEVYVFDNRRFQKLGDFEAAESVAKKAGRGVWGDCSGDFHSAQ